MVSIQSNLNNFSVMNELMALFSGVERTYRLIITRDGTILPDISICPNCSSSLSKNGQNDCKDKRAKGFGLNFRKGRVVCSNPNCSFKINIKSSVVDSWFSSFKEWIETIVLSLGTKKLSLGKIRDHLKETFGVVLSVEYLRMLLQKIMKKKKKPEPKEESSDVLVHDEQFVRIKGIEYKRISTLDANNSNVYYDELHDDRRAETMIQIFQELKEKLGEIRAAVIDGCGASKNAFEEVFTGILIQHCLFHFLKNVREAYVDEVGYGKGRSRLPLEYLIGFLSIANVLFDHDREINELRKLQKELDDHVQRINASNLPLAKKQEYMEDYNERYDIKAVEYLHNVRKARRRKNGIKLVLRTEEQAKALLKKAKDENVFPKKVQKQVERLEKKWKNFTHCMRDSTIPPTTNKAEQYYALTLNWIEKNNLQSKDQFYQEQKFFLTRRYNIPLFKQGLFTEFLRKTFVLLLAFGGT